MTFLQVADPGWLVAQHRARVMAALERVVDSGWYILGSEVDRFEAEFAAWTETAHGAGVGSGTDAVALALRGCGVGPGDAVFTVSNTAVATVAAIWSIGAMPVLVDIDANSYCMSGASLREAIEMMADNHPELRPAAVVLVHLYGNPVAVAEIGGICTAAGLDLVEDAAQAHGAAVEGRPVGSFGRAAAFSFYPTKNLGALGDGGMVVTSDPTVVEAVLLERQYGWRIRYVSDRVGRNSRLDELHAAVLRELLPEVRGWNDHRIQVADAYRGALADSRVKLPVAPPEGVRHVYHQFVIQHADRDALAAHLRSADIGTAVLYPVPVHLQPAYESSILRVPDLSVTEEASGRILSLPMGPHVSTQDVERIADAVRASERSQP